MAQAQNLVIGFSYRLPDGRQGGLVELSSDKDTAVFAVEKVREAYGHTETFPTSEHVTLPIGTAELLRLLDKHLMFD